jgi:hypothetical protein
MPMFEGLCGLCPMLPKQTQAASDEEKLSIFYLLSGSRIRGRSIVCAAPKHLRGDDDDITVGFAEDAFVLLVLPR